MTRYDIHALRRERNIWNFAGDITKCISANQIFEYWLALTNTPIDLAPVPLRFFSNVVTLHWHTVNVSKMSTLLKLRPTNGGDIVLALPLATDVSKRFIGRDCFHTRCYCREQWFCALWRHRSEATCFHIKFFGCFRMNFKQARHISILDMILSTYAV